MDIETIAVDTVALGRNRDEVSRNLDLIMKDIAALNQSMSELNLMWTGSANEAFNQAVQDDISDLKRICTAIKELVDYETNAVTEYDNCENKISMLIQDMNI